MNEQQQKELRSLVRTMYDYQDMRLRTANRLRLKADDTDMDETFMDDAEISEKDYDVIEYVKLSTQKIEKRISKELKRIIEPEPIWKTFFLNVRGCGHLMSAAILSEFNIQKAETVSKMWQFAGLNSSLVKGKKIIKITKNTDKSQLIKEYENKDGEKCGIILTNEMVRGDKRTPGFVAPYNSWLRTKLCGVLAGGMIKASVRWEEIPAENYIESPFMRLKDKKYEKANTSSDYVRLYLEYKFRLEHEENKVMHIGKETAWKDVSKGHRDAAAKRYMIKMFIKDLYVAWRTLEGLTVRVPYHEEYLGHKHVVNE
jgi:hypothetical protein